MQTLNAMNSTLARRLAVLLERTHQATSGVVVFRTNVDAGGDVESYTLPAIRQTLTPEAFWKLVGDWTDVVFFPGDTVSDAEHDAYWSLEADVSSRLTWADMLAENAGAESAATRARDDAEAANPVRAAMAAAYVGREEEAEDAFWAPMRERADRLSL